MGSAYSRRQKSPLLNHASTGYRRRKLSQEQGTDHQSRKPFTFKPGDKIRLDPVISPENLVRVFLHLRTVGGEAPGLDGIRYSDLGRSEVWEAMRGLCQAVKSGNYRPQPPRIVEIAKKSGGTRQLRLRVILDRVLAAAIYFTINPVIDPSFSPFSVGFRPGRDRLEILAAIDWATQQGKWVIAEDDITKAFDNVPITRTVEAFRKFIPDTGLMSVIERVLRGGKDDRLVGIDQGSALSPLALNVLLDEVLDKPLRVACPGTPLWRYADNLVGVCQSVTEALDLLTSTKQLSDSTGMSLKGHVPEDLRGKGTRVNILGFTLLQDDQGKLNYEVPGESWLELEEELQGTWKTSNPGKAAIQVAVGWIEAMVPGLGNERGDVVGEVHRLLTRTGYLEIDVQVLQDTARGAWARWNSIRDRMADTLRQLPHRSTPDYADVGSRTTAPPARHTAVGGRDRSPKGQAILAH